jgi:outer membrane usher protein
MRAARFSAMALALILGAPAYGQVVVPLPGHETKPPVSAPPSPVEAATPTQIGPAAPSSSPPSAPAVPMGVHGRPDINPYERDIDMTVPLLYQDRSLGDLPVRLTFDDQFFVQTAGFVDLIQPQLNPAAQEQLRKILGTRATFTAEDLAGSGVSLIYDPSSLSIVVLSINPQNRAVEQLFTSQQDHEGAADIKPANISGYLNLSVNEALYESGGKTLAPTVGLNGALRMHNIVFETEGSLSDSSGTLGGDSTYSFQRSYARLVYDEPDSFRRWFIGDLTPEVRGEQGFAQMGGVGVIRSRLPFNDFRSAVLQTNHEIVLQRDSDLSIMRNGVLFEQLHLRAGSYDLSALPLLAGSNDVQIQLKDNTGETQNIAFQSYLDPIDLAPGDYEYGAYLGALNENIGSSPTYNGPLAFSGFFRKAYLNRPALGLGLQLSKDVQNLTGQTQFLLPHGARLLLDAGASNSSQVGGGFAVGMAYEREIDRGGLADSFTVRTDYLSRRFTGLSSPEADNSTALTTSVQYSRGFSTKLTASGGLTFVTQRDGKGDNYRADVAVSYGINRQWSVRGGVDYAHFSDTSLGGRGVGGVFSLVWQPNVRTRAEARYDSSINSAALSVTRSDSNQINSLGYGGVLSRDSGQNDLSGFADYTANRFTASVAHSVSGDGSSSFGSVNVTSVTLGTTIAFADGALGVGRRVSDGFAVLYPHPSLQGHRVVAGESVDNNNYIGESGLLGGAVDNALASYTVQSVQYSVVDPPTGYDIGPGVVRVKPPYRGGYAIQVGTDSFVTAMGTLVGTGGAPIALIGGRVVAVDRSDIPPVAFFTNTVGRFGVLGLRPGVHYIVEMYVGSEVRTAFDFTVPNDTTGLVDLKTVRLQPRS